MGDLPTVLASGTSCWMRTVFPLRQRHPGTVPDRACFLMFLAHFDSKRSLRVSFLDSLLNWL